MLIFFNVAYIGHILELYFGFICVKVLFVLRNTSLYAFEHISNDDFCRSHLSILHLSIEHKNTVHHEKLFNLINTLLLLLDN